MRKNRLATSCLASDGKSFLSHCRNAPVQSGRRHEMVPEHLHQPFQSALSILRTSLQRTLQDAHASRGSAPMPLRLCVFARGSFVENGSPISVSDKVAKDLRQPAFHGAVPDEFCPDEIAGPEDLQWLKTECSCQGCELTTNHISAFLNSLPGDGSSGASISQTILEDHDEQFICTPIVSDLS